MAAILGQFPANFRFSGALCASCIALINAVKGCSMDSAFLSRLS